MLNRKSVFIFFLSVLIAFPLSSFSSRKKELDDDEAALQRQQELLEKREQAEAEIEARKKAAEEAELAAKLEAERLEAERIAKEKADEEARILEEERLEEERRLEAERLEKENEELAALQQKKEQELLQQQMELESEKQKNAPKTKRREYLSDYMVYDTESIDVVDTTEEEDYYRVENPDKKDISGRTLLMHAAKAGNEFELKNLLRSGADVNLTDKDGWTALMYAVRYCENPECVEILLSGGADSTKKNKYDSSALVLASCYNPNPQILKRLLSVYKSSDKEVLRAMVFLLTEENMAETQQLEKLQLFMDMGIPLNVLYEGKSPLIYAAQYGRSTKIIQKLLDNNASVTLRSIERKTAFDYACENKNLAHDETYWALNKR